MQPVKSSNIEAIGYSGTTLKIKFKSGATWLYHDVPEHIHRELVTAESVGGYFSSNIRNKFKSAKHEEPKS